MTATSAAKPTTSITPITTTRILSARIGSELDRNQIRPTAVIAIREVQGGKALAPSIPLAGLGPAIHVFKPADRKDLPNQGYLDGSDEFSKREASALCSFPVVLRRAYLCGALHRLTEISRIAW
jgi:hypothetical protein